MPARSHSRTPKAKGTDPGTPRGTGMAGVGMHSAGQWTESDEEAHKTAKKNLRHAMEDEANAKPPEEKKQKQEEEQARGRSKGPDREAKEKRDASMGQEEKRGPDPDVVAIAATDKKMNTNGAASSNAAAAADTPVPADTQNMEQQVLMNIHTLNQNVKKLQENQEQAKKDIETLQNMAKQNMVDKREDEDKTTAKMYDIMGIPIRDDRHNKEQYIDWMLQQIGLNRNTLTSMEVVGQASKNAYVETWRLKFKDFTTKKKIHDMMKAKDLEYYSGGESWGGWKVWGRWCEGPVSRIVRDTLNVLWKVYKEVVGENTLYSDNGMELDYRLAGIFDKKDRAPRAIVVYDESHGDPRAKIYVRPPDGEDHDVFIEYVRDAFKTEEEVRDQKKNPERSSGSELPKVPHELEKRRKNYRHSFRDMKQLNEDHPKYMNDIIAHAVNTVEARKGKGNKGKKGKGKGGKDRDEKGKGKGEKGKEKGDAHIPGRWMDDEAEFPPPGGKQGGERWDWGKGTKGAGKGSGGKW